MLREVLLSSTNGELWLLFDHAHYDLYHIVDVHVRRHRQALPEGMQKSIMWQMLNGIHYLHSNWVLHRDLVRRVGKKWECLCSPSAK